jgi:hypothetical protein
LVTSLCPLQTMATELLSLLPSEMWALIISAPVLRVSDAYTWSRVARGVFVFLPDKNRIRARFILKLLSNDARVARHLWVAAARLSDWMDNHPNISFQTLLHFAVALKPAGRKARFFPRLVARALSDAAPDAFLDFVFFGLNLVTFSRRIEHLTLSNALHGNARILRVTRPARWQDQFSFYKEMGVVQPGTLLGSKRFLKEPAYTHECLANFQSLSDNQRWRAMNEMLVKKFRSEAECAQVDPTLFQAYLIQEQMTLPVLLSNVYLVWAQNHERLHPGHGYHPSPSTMLGYFASTGFPVQWLNVIVLIYYPAPGRDVLTEARIEYERSILRF